MCSAPSPAQRRNSWTALLSIFESQPSYFEMGSAVYLLEEHFWVFLWSSVTAFILWFRVGFVVPVSLVQSIRP